MHEMKPHRMCYKTHKKTHDIGSRSDALDAFSIDLISTVITPLDQRLRLKCDPMNLSSPCTPLYLSEDQRLRFFARSDAPQAVTSSSRLDR